MTSEIGSKAPETLAAPMAALQAGYDSFADTSIDKASAAANTVIAKMGAADNKVTKVAGINAEIVTDLEGIIAEGKAISDLLAQAKTIKKTMVGDTKKVDEAISKLEELKKGVLEKYDTLHKRVKENGVLVAKAQAKL